MSLQTTIDINVDFYDKKHILVNAKQYDNKSRFISISCYNNGETYPINSNEHSAYVRYKKADNYSAFNFCEIYQNGKILVELTEQMLAASGICCVDLVIVEKGNAKVNTNTGEIVNIDNSSILSTMTFYIDVIESAVENSEIESGYEFNVLNETLKKYEANYENVILAAKSWAVGDTGIRDNEFENNAKYWAEVAAQNAVGTPIIVTGIKGSNETSYRNGQVNLTAENVGAIPTTDIATVNEVKQFLGI